MTGSASWCWSPRTPPTTDWISTERFAWSSLLGRLEQIDGLDWIRLMYLYPIHFTDELVGLIADSEKILPYLDLPLQHINSEVLKRMQRRVDRAGTVRLLETSARTGAQPRAPYDVHRRIPRARPTSSSRNCCGLRR